MLEALEAGQAYRFASLDAPRPDGDASEPLRERIGQEDTELVRAEERATLDPLLAQLPLRQRQTVELRFFEGLTQSEIAAPAGNLPDAGLPPAGAERGPTAFLRQTAERAQPGQLSCGCC